MWRVRQRVSNYSQRFFEFITNQLEPWRSDTRVSHPNLFLDQLNQLHEFRNRIHSQ